MKCPRCSVILIPTHQTGNRYECPQCRGTASSRADVGLMIGVRRRARLRRAAEDADHTSDHLCPFCAGRMARLVMPIRAGEMEFDCCAACEGVWLDHPGIAHFSAVDPQPDGHEPDSATPTALFGPSSSSGLGAQIAAVIRTLLRSR